MNTAIKQPIPAFEVAVPLPQVAGQALPATAPSPVLATLERIRTASAAAEKNHDRKLTGTILLGFAGLVASFAATAAGLAETVSMAAFTGIVASLNFGGLAAPTVVAYLAARRASTATKLLQPLSGQTLSPAEQTVLNEAAGRTIADFQPRQGYAAWRKELLAIRAGGDGDDASVASVKDAFFAIFSGANLSPVHDPLQSVELLAHAFEHAPPALNPELRRVVEDVLARKKIVQPAARNADWYRFAMLQAAFAGKRLRFVDHVDELKDVATRKGADYDIAVSDIDLQLKRDKRDQEKALFGQAWVRGVELALSVAAHFERAGYHVSIKESDVGLISVIAYDGKPKAFMHGRR